MQNKKEVSIVVVNYNGRKYLKKCFDSICSLDYPEEKLETIMVDNCSIDRSTQFVEKTFPKTNIIKNNINNYCKACNLGIKNANGEFIAFLNNDMHVDKKWLSELLGVIRGDGGIGAVGGKILFLNGKIQSTGHVISNIFSWKDRGFMEDDKWQYNKIEAVESLCGGAILYKKECLKDIGQFDERFNMYYEDVDMALRCKKKGWKLIYVPKAIAYHKFRGTATDDFVVLQAEKNRILVVAKHFPDKLNEFARNISKELLDRDKAIGAGKKGVSSLKKERKWYQKQLQEREQEFKKHLQEKDTQLQERDKQLQNKSYELEEKNKQLQNIFNSRTWRVIKRIDKLRGVLKALKVSRSKTLVRKNREDF